VRIEFLHQNIYGVGGTVRSVINLANALSVDHDVRIVSLFRRVDTPTLDISPRVTLAPLIDVRAGGRDVGNPLHNERSRFVPPAEELFNQYSRLTDERLATHLATTDADVVVGTRPALNLLVATSGREDLVRVAQEHTTITKLDASVITRMRDAYDGIDVVTTVSSADRDRVIEMVGLEPGRVFVLPNGIPRPPVMAVDGVTRILVAGGRLAEQKRYDVLLRAFARVNDRHPDWRLRIYGDGPLDGALRKLALELGVGHAVDFMGATSNMHMEWAKGEIAVCSSDYESFGMTIVEALRCGVPVVSTDCPDGPREILTHGKDGLLVTVGDPQALADGIGTLISDSDRRRKMAEAGLETSERYDPLRVADVFLGQVGGVKRSLGRRLRAALGRNLPSRGSRRGLPAPFAAERAAPVDPGVGIEVVGATSLRLVGDPALLAGAFWKNGAGTRVHVRGSEASETFDGGLLDEGIWNLHATVAGSGRTVRIRPLWIDTRVLIATDADDAPGEFRRVVPYTTLSGHVGLRVWRRQRHVEVRALSTDGATFTVELQLTGAWRDVSGVVAVAQRPSGVGEFELSQCVVDGPRAALTWPARMVADRRVLSREVWNVVLRAEGEQVPAAFLSTDVPDLRRIRVLPSVTLDESVVDPRAYVSGVSGVEVSARVGPQNSLQVCTAEV